MISDYVFNPYRQLTSIMRQRPFKEIDVFTNVAFKGNPLAVVLDGQDLSTEQMQNFANWTNFSETTFVLPPTDSKADYQVRIFTPTMELPFAGHPTLGTCHAWLSSQASGLAQKGLIVQQCAAGLITIKRDGQRLAFAAPPLRRSGKLDADETAAIAQALGIQVADIVASAWCDNGPGWRGVLLNSVELLRQIKPDPKKIAGQFIGIASSLKIGASAIDEKVNSAANKSENNADQPFLEVRAFFPGAGGFAEDPVTGSLNAALAQWLIGSGRAPSKYIAAQGLNLNRNGRVYIEQTGSDIWVGGYSTTCVEGQVLL
jgi:PhzF family phenazine biosynthesis protein